MFSKITTYYFLRASYVHTLPYALNTPSLVFTSSKVDIISPFIEQESEVHRSYMSVEDPVLELRAAGSQPVLCMPPLPQHTPFPSDKEEAALVGQELLPEL